MHATRITSHAPECAHNFPPTSKGSDTIILIQKCVCGYEAPVWDGMKGVKK